MDDVNNHVIKPLCARHGTSYALQQSPGGLHAQVFVSHAWKEPFQQFTRSIFETYETSPTKPTLWICTFALVQSDDEDFIASQIGNADEELRSTPFARALEQANELLVVRNNVIDLYTRLWCVCELFFAHEFGFLPHRVRVTGSDVFADAPDTTCINARCTSLSDRNRIIREIVGNNNLRRVREVDETIRKFRKLEAHGASSPYTMMPSTMATSSPNYDDPALQSGETIVLNPRFVMGAQHSRPTPGYPARDRQTSPSSVPAEAVYEPYVAADTTSVFYDAVVMDLSLGIGHDYAAMSSRPSNNEYATLGPQYEVAVALNSTYVSRSRREDVGPFSTGEQGDDDQQLAEPLYDIAVAVDGEHYLEVDGSTSDDTGGVLSSQVMDPAFFITFALLLLSQ